MTIDEARSILDTILEDHPNPRFGVRLWDGTTVAGAWPADFELAVDGPETFYRCFVACDAADVAQAYVDGRLDVTGDLEGAVALAAYVCASGNSIRDQIRLALRRLGRGTRHNVATDVRDVQSHYDLGDEWFRLFLDEKMVYSCAYFANREQSLEKAQERKLDLVCRKLRLTEGENFLDIGCGWGALLFWAATHYGVRAHGITLSRNQAAAVRQRAADAGVTDRVTVEVAHYASLPRAAYDKIASVGMYEHVGTSSLRAYLRVVECALRPGGLFLNHGITDLEPTLANAGGAFIFRHVFPGAALAPHAVLQTEIERTGFEILDVQSLRPHYVLTLREWQRRLASHWSDARKMGPERLFRTFRVYLLGSAHAFERGVLGVHQILGAKPGADGRVRAPLDRADAPASIGDPLEAEETSAEAA